MFCKGINELHFKGTEQNFVAPKSALFRFISNYCFFIGVKTEKTKRDPIKERPYQKWSEPKNYARFKIEVFYFESSRLFRMIEY